MDNQPEKVLATLDSKDLRKARWLRSKHDAIETVLEKTYDYCSQYHQENTEFVRYLRQKYDIPDTMNSFLTDLRTGKITPVSPSRKYTD
jgi:hypothetical protein